jgi:hypothetical protein
MRCILDLSFTLIGIWIPYDPFFWFLFFAARPKLGAAGARIGNDFLTAGG